MKKEIFVDLEEKHPDLFAEFNHYGFTADDIHSLYQKLSLLGYKRFSLEPHGDFEDSYRLDFEGVRLETDDECKQRLLNEERDAKLREAREKKEYERLKSKYE